MQAVFQLDIQTHTELLDIEAAPIDAERGADIAGLLRGEVLIRGGLVGIAAGPADSSACSFVGSSISRLWNPCLHFSFQQLKISDIAFPRSVKNVA